jgi:Uma2 family endonuclease
VCEIVSPSTAARDRAAKRALYARYGVRHYWLVDPASRTLEALELQGERWVELGAWDDTASVQIAPFEAVTLDIARLFLPKTAERAEDT